MAFYASVLLIGAIVVLLIAGAMVYLVSRRADAPPDVAAASMRSDSKQAAPMWSSHVGSLHDLVDRPPSDEIPAWKLHAEAARAGNPGVYKTRGASSFGGDHWNPYAESQSTASRVKAARRKPRPHRPPPPTDAFESRVTPGDPYALLGVSAMASLAEIEQAYRRQVSAIHPDKFYRDPEGRASAHEKLKRLNAAMQVLRDRRSYTHDDGGGTL